MISHVPFGHGLVHNAAYGRNEILLVLPFIHASRSPSQPGNVSIRTALYSVYLIGVLRRGQLAIASSTLHWQDAS